MREFPICRYFYHCRPNSKEFKNEKRRYYANEPYARSKGWWDFLDEVIECEYHDEQPSPPYYSSRGRDFATAYRNLEGRARAYNDLHSQRYPEVAVLRNNDYRRSTRYDSPERTSLYARNSSRTYERRPANQASAETHRPSRASFQSDLSAHHSSGQQAAPEQDNPPPYESAENLAYVLEQSRVQAAAPTPVATSHPSSRHAHDQHVQVPNTRDPSSQSHSTRVPVSAPRGLSRLFSRLGIGRRRTTADHGTPTLTLAQQQQADQMLNAFGTGGLIGVLEVITTALANRSG